MRGIFWLIVGLAAAAMYSHTGHFIPFTMAVLATPYGIHAIIVALSKEV